MKKKKLLAIIPIIVLLLGICLYQMYQRYYQITYISRTYTTTNAHLSNPYRGWYRIYGYTISDTDPINTDAIFSIGQGDDTPQLALVQINLSNYKNTQISSAGLTELDRLFHAWGQTDKQLIVRFLYDWNGNAKETEPDDFALIKTHMSQVAPIVNQYKNGIYLLQGIFVGNCGEMNNSNYMSNEHMYELIHHLAGVITQELFISVRTPAHWRTACESFAPLSGDSAFDGSFASRLGLFNDGMLGSGNDLGTYGDTSLSPATSFDDKGTRQEEISFQNSLCCYVPNGGEVVRDNPYNDFEAAVSDLSQMHVSYLNCDYDRSVLDKWQASTYEGNDCFDGTDGYDYIGEHLGYRYAIVSSSCDFDTWRDETASFSITIENSGFSISYRQFHSVLTLQNTTDGTIVTVPIASDNRYWASGTKTTLLTSIDIRGMVPGTYDIYFNLTDPVTQRQIQFANDLPLSDAGYLLGSLSISK